MDNALFPTVGKEDASQEAIKALDSVESAFGGIPNLMKKVASSPGVLNGIMSLNNEIMSGCLPSDLIEQIALFTSFKNGCDYCVAVHVQVGQQFGLNRTELIRNMNGQASKPKVQAVLDFVEEVIEQRGNVSANTITRLENIGYNGQEILEILGVVGLYTFLNYAKHLTKPVLDFPKVSEFSKEASLTS